MEDKTRTIMVSILNEGAIQQGLADVLMSFSQQDKYNLIINYPSDRPITNNRNKIVQRFLTNKECDYLLMIDDDIVPPKNILNLADFQKDIISPVCFIYQYDKGVWPVVLKRSREGTLNPIDITEKQGLIECDAVGTGTIMLSRKVLEAIRFPFQNEYDADGVKKWGLDLNFCEKAKKLGFKVYCHLDYICSHWYLMDLKLIYAMMVEFKNRLKNNKQKNAI